MKNDLIVHPATSKHIAQLVAQPHHALLIMGPDGIGKSTLAAWLASQLLGLNEHQLAQHPYYLLLKPAENGTVSIETVRSIQKFLQLKTTGASPIRRIVCLEHADGLTQEAQNALLKLLEEPPADTVIMLTVHSKRSLLPTILSRAQVLQVHQPTQPELEAFFATAASNDDVRKAYFLSGGLPGLMHGILNKDSDHPLLAQVSVAKELLQKPLYERLGMVDTLTKQKDALGTLLEALQRIAESGLKQAGGTKDQKGLRRWHSIKKEVFEAQEALARSANSKLVLTKMLLHM